jgi:hypothetical protein
MDFALSTNEIIGVNFKIKKIANQSEKPAFLWKFLHFLK